MNEDNEICHAQDLHKIKPEKKKNPSLHGGGSHEGPPMAEELGN